MLESYCVLLTSSVRDIQTNDIFNTWARLPLTSAAKCIINDNTSFSIIQIPNILRLNKLKERFNLIYMYKKNGNSNI